MAGLEDPDDGGGSFDLELAAASLRADSGDVHVLLKVLADQLGDALGDRLQVKRAGGLFRRSDQIASLSATVGDDRFEAVVEGPTMRCTVGHSSGGIRIRSDAVPPDQWTTRLLTALQAEAAHSTATRQALERLVIGGQA